MISQTTSKILAVMATLDINLLRLEDLETNLEEEPVIGSDVVA